jgi:hypothetical protein
MAVCYQNLTVAALSSRNARSMLVGMLFKKFGLFLNTLRIYKHSDNKWDQNNMKEFGLTSPVLLWKNFGFDSVQV